jgi:hypothetical protein
MTGYNFDDIRPYYDSEVKAKMRLMLKDKVFDDVLMHLFKNRPKVEMVKFQLRRVRSTKQLQGVFIYDLLHWLIDKTSKGIRCTGIDKLDKNKPYLFSKSFRPLALPLSACALNSPFENSQKTDKLFPNPILVAFTTSILLPLARVIGGNALALAQPTSTNRLSKSNSPRILVLESPRFANIIPLRGIGIIFEIKVIFLSRRQRT